MPHGPMTLSPRICFRILFLLVATITIMSSPPSLSPRGVSSPNPATKLSRKKALGQQRTRRCRERMSKEETAFCRHLRRKNREMRRILQEDIVEAVESDGSGPDTDVTSPSEEDSRGGENQRRQQRRRDDTDEHRHNISMPYTTTEQELLDNLKRYEQADGQNNGGGEQENEGGSDSEENGANSKDRSFFEDATDSPVKALLLFYLNSGLMRFHKHRDYMDCWDGKDVDIASLVDEIESEEVKDADIGRTVRNYIASHSYTGNKLPACGCCGLRCMERAECPVVHYRQMFLDEPNAQVLRYVTGSDEYRILLDQIRNPGSTVQIPVNEAWDMETVEVWKLKSIYEEAQSDGSTTYWHLHPDLVELLPTSNRLFTTVCPICSDALSGGKRPTLSIAAGVDFGHYRRLGLTLPNLLELQILSRTRLFFATMKISSNLTGVVNSSLQSRFKCHAILFPHDAPTVASYMYNPDIFGPQGILDPEHLKGLMQVYMVDDKANVDSLFRHVFGTAVVTARPWVIAQWLLVLQSCNPFYKDLDLSRLSRTTEIIENLNTYIKAATVRATNPETVEYEQGIGFDVAEVQNTHVGTEHDVDERSPPEQDPGLPGPPPLPYVYLCNQDRTGVPSTRPQA